MNPPTDSEENDFILVHSHLSPLVANMLRLIALTLIAGSIFLGALTLKRANLPYNVEGRFFDAVVGVVYKAQAVEAYGALALCLALIGGCTYLFTLPLSESKGSNHPFNRPDDSRGFHRLHRVPRA